MIVDSVGSVLAGQKVVTLAPGQTVRDAAALLSQHRIGAAPVLDGEMVVGIFTERDVLGRVVAECRDPATTMVEAVMTAHPISVHPGTSLVKAFGLMVEGAFRHLPVVDDEGRLVGVLSMRDIPPEYRIMHRQWTEWMVGAGSGAAVSPI